MLRPTESSDCAATGHARQTQQPAAQQPNRSRERNRRRSAVAGEAQREGRAAACEGGRAETERDAVGVARTGLIRDRIQSGRLVQGQTGLILKVAVVLDGRAGFALRCADDATEGGICSRTVGGLRGQTMALGNEAFAME